jgi:preprotein translocase subunit SecD
LTVLASEPGHGISAVVESERQRFVIEPGTEIARAVDLDTRQGVVSFQLSPAEAERFFAFTRSHEGRRMQILVGCDVVVEAVIQAPIAGGIRLTTPDESTAKALQARLQTGAPFCDR